MEGRLGDDTEICMEKEKGAGGGRIKISEMLAVTSWPV